jgi:hypothetical protein
MSKPNIIQITPLPNNKVLLAETTLISGIDNKGIIKYTPNGNYIVTASSYASSSTLPYMAFNGSDTNYWQCDYNGTTYDINKKYPIYTTDSFNGKNPSTYQGGGAQANTWTTSIGNVSFLGEWLQIQLPYSIFLYNYTIKTPNFTINSTFPTRFAVVGSNDGTTWEYIDQQNVKTPVSNSKPTRVYNINSTKAYSYFRLIISEMPNAAKNIAIKQWNLNGVTELTPNPDYKTNESFVTLSRWMDILNSNLTNSKEGFEDYGYTPSNMIPQYTSSQFKSDVINSQVNPMIQISSDYSTSLLNVDTKYTLIGNGITTITNTDQTGIRDIMVNNPMYDFSGNSLNNDDRKKTVVDAQIEDIDSMVKNTNTVYIIGSITLVTLLVFSVVIGRE